MGLTLPIEGIGFSSYKVDFGHERISPTDDPEDLRRTFALIEEFNEAKLDKAVRRYKRLVQEILSEEDDEPAPPPRRRRRPQS